MPRGFRDVHLEIHSTIDALDLVQAVTEHIARALGLDEEALHWTSMAVRESVINAITHGNNSDPGQARFHRFRRHTRVESRRSDRLCARSGRAASIQRRLRVRLTPDNVLKASGRGIFLIRQFMDDVSLQRTREGGMEMRMVKHIRSS